VPPVNLPQPAGCNGGATAPPPAVTGPPAAPPAVSAPPAQHGSARGSYRGGGRGSTSRGGRNEVMVEMAGSEYEAARSPGTSPPASPHDHASEGEKENYGMRPSGGAVAQVLRGLRKLPGVSYLMRAVGGGSATEGNKEQTILWRGMGNMRVTDRFLLLGGTEVHPFFFLSPSPSPFPPFTPPAHKKQAYNNEQTILLARHGQYAGDRSLLGGTSLPLPFVAAPPLLCHTPTQVLWRGIAIRG
jgi:hypothetical protein